MGCSGATRATTPADLTPYARAKYAALPAATDKPDDEPIPISKVTRPTPRAATNEAAKIYNSHRAGPQTRQLLPPPNMPRPQGPYPGMIPRMNPANTRHRLATPSTNPPNTPYVTTP